ncbi:universal stress protein family protein [Thermodesulfitimonas autotrophica]|uniref:Universal stress protein family protein n=1 Tax=Thermodesulfitimonas autotrophica TaxID=1894989 RepID=A0A3N5C143_9THEO|nr:universal stress protein [Thermodesulfitimonas autotrophica]RPF49871.1 universal stress protein family protein [Thermodesulfitimonas autotrophica]
MAPQKVLLLVDNTTFSERAAEFTVKLLKANPDLEATLLFAGHHRDFVPEGPGVGWINQEEFSQLVENQAKAAFQKVLAVFRAAGIGVQTVVDYCDPVKAVIRLVKEGDYSLVVLGGKGTADRLNYVLHSDVYRLTHLLDVPLVVVK